MAYSAPDSFPRATFSDENARECMDTKRDVPQVPSAARITMVMAKTDLGVLVSKAASRLRPSINTGARNLVVVEVMTQMVVVRRTKRPAA